MTSFKYTRGCLLKRNKNEQSEGSVTGKFLPLRILSSPLCRHSCLSRAQRWRDWEAPQRTFQRVKNSGAENHRGESETFNRQHQSVTGSVSFSNVWHEVKYGCWYSEHGQCYVYSHFWLTNEWSEWTISRINCATRNVTKQMHSKQQVILLHD